MAENPVLPAVDDHEEESSYKAPAPAALDEMLNKDKDDESLEKYKKTLLGDAANAIVFPEDPRRVIVQKLGMIVQGRPDVEMDLSGDITKLKETPMVLKEGTSYRIKIYFYVQREIVSGLKYVQMSYRKGIKVDKSNMMVGSYGPKKELQSYMTAAEDAPSGLIARGSYTIKSKFTDDDKNDHLSWEWKLDIKKDWE